ncbi:MAG TPA: RDD family protein [Flavipsychrobacter sp.]|nr:RDD family protein [Flavipsychrobacter sp.]
MDNTASLIFPERRVVDASFLRRFAAILIDTIVLLIPDIFLRYIVGAGNIMQIFYMDSDLLFRTTIYYLLSTIISWLYFSLQESGVHQATIGKRAMGIRVTNMEGFRISFANATGRYFAKTISFLIILMGYFMVLWDDKNQGLHDKLANTLVVKDTLPI